VATVTQIVDMRNKKNIRDTRGASIQRQEEEQQVAMRSGESLCNTSITIANDITATSHQEMVMSQKDKED
jgi:hypothetical protein